MRKYLLINAALIALSLCLSHTYSDAQTAQQIVKNVKQKFDQVKDYTVSVTASVNMEKVKIPEMKATLFFKQPDKVHIESKNFSMLPKEGMGLSPADMLEKFDATLLKSEKRNGVLCYDLRLVSKVEREKRVREYFVTVNGDIWAVSHLESFPMPGRKVVIDITHTLVADQYWLPSSLRVEYSTEQADDSQQDQSPMPGGGRRSMPKNGSASIRYSDYRVNTGLSDELFEKKTVEKK